MARGLRASFQNSRTHQHRVHVWISLQLFAQREWTSSKTSCDRSQLVIGKMSTADSTPLPPHLSKKVQSVASSDLPVIPPQSTNLTIVYHYCHIVSWRQVQCCGSARSSWRWVTFSKRAFREANPDPNLDYSLAMSSINILICKLDCNDVWTALFLL